MLLLTLECLLKRTLEKHMHVFDTKLELKNSTKIHATMQTKIE